MWDVALNGVQVSSKYEQQLKYIVPCPKGGRAGLHGENVVSETWRAHRAGSAACRGVDSNSAY